MIKTSKVKSVQGNGTWESKHGILYKFEYQMEDGSVLSANHKTQDGNFNVGDAVEYEIKGTNDFGSWGSVKKPNEVPQSYKGGGDNLIGIKVGHALNCASTLLAHRIDKYSRGSELHDALKSTAKMIFQISEELNKELAPSTTPSVAPSKPPVKTTAKQDEQYDKAYDMAMAEELEYDPDLPF